MKPSGVPGETAHAAANWCEGGNKRLFAPLAPHKPPPMISMDSSFPTCLIHTRRSPSNVPFEKNHHHKCLALQRTSGTLSALRSSVRRCSLCQRKKKKKRDRKAKRYLADVRTTPKERAKSINCHALFEVVLQCPTHPCKGKGMRGGFSFILLIVYILTSQIVYELLLSIIALCMRWHAPYVNCFDCSLYLTVIFRCARCAVCAVCSIC